MSDIGCPSMKFSASGFLCFFFLLKTFFTTKKHEKKRKKKKKSKGRKERKTAESHSLTIDLNLEHCRILAKLVLQLDSVRTIVHFAGILDGEDGMSFCDLHIESAKIHYSLLVGCIDLFPRLP